MLRGEGWVAVLEGEGGVTKIHWGVWPLYIRHRGVTSWAMVANVGTRVTTTGAGQPHMLPPPVLASLCAAAMGVGRPAGRCH